MKKLLSLTFAVLFSASLAFSQGIAIGLRGGLTLTSGNTNLPVQSNRVPPLPEIKNEGDGQGAGFAVGAFARFKLAGFFLQGEVNYTRFLLKQKSSTDFDSPTPLGTATATLATKTETTLDAINIPILFGKSFAGGLVRAYLGPSFIIATKAEQQGDFTSSASFGGVVISAPTTTNLTQDLLTEDAGVIEVKPLIIAIEVGAGLSLPMGLDIDLRYGVPAITGVYKNSDVSGFLGILSLSVGYRLAKLGL
ncbi:MAG TPA: PorT family protein [Microscillaceae bacterium]|nr:PorT family protein [Microscillaceae bacterium]